MTSDRFRRKPVVVSAMQWDGENTDAIVQWAKAGRPRWWVRQIKLAGREVRLAIPTLEGTMQASPGDWIIRGVEGELYPCKSDIFAKTYEPVGGSASLACYACGGSGPLACPDCGAPA